MLVVNADEAYINNRKLDHEAEHRSEKAGVHFRESSYATENAINPTMAIGPDRFSHASNGDMNVRHAAATIWGSILIAIGLGLVVYQFAIQSSAPSPPSFTQKLETSKTGLVVETHYPGVELIVIGAFLVVVGEFRQKPK